MFVGCNDNINNIDSDRVIFTIKDTKLYVPVVTLSASDNQFLAKDFKDQFIEMNIKQKGRIKIRQLNIDIYLI